MTRPDLHMQPTLHTNYSQQQTHQQNVASIQHGRGGNRSPVKKYWGEYPFAPPSFSHFLGSFMLRMCLQLGLHSGHNWGSLQRSLTPYLVDRELAATPQ